MKSKMRDTEKAKYRSTLECRRTGLWEYNL